MHIPKVTESKPKPVGRTYREDLLVQIAQHEDHDQIKPYGYGFPTLSSPKESTIYSAAPAAVTQYHHESWPNRTRSRVIDSDSLFPPMFFPRGSRRSSKSYSYTTNASPTKISLGFRIFQIISIIIVGTCLYALVDNILFLMRSYGDDEPFAQEDSKKSANIHDQLQSWVIHGEEDFNVLPSSVHRASAKQDGSNNGVAWDVSQYPNRIYQNLVVSDHSLTFIHSNSSVCSSVRRKLNEKSNHSVHKAFSGSDYASSTIPGQEIYFMIIVHSAPDHFSQRQTIRSTWGSVKSLKNFAIRLVFILGRHQQKSRPSSLENSIRRENELFGDIVIGNFVDSYRNLTYKHLMGYKWVQEYCSGATFILKTDDDAYVDIFQLFDFVSKNYGFSPSPGTLICNVFPEGTKPVREKATRGSKWSVTMEEYPYSVYPKYCGGLAYLATPDVISRILDVSDRVKFFWIDDVYITGILREIAKIEPFYLNLRYSYDPEEYRQWLLPGGTKYGSENNSKTSLQKMRKFPFLFAHVEHGHKFSEEMNDLWRKSLRTWSQ